MWFKMDVGHNQRADARWILPVLCRRGHITKTDIGAIRIAADETYFEVPRAVSGKFLDALGRTQGKGHDDTDDIAIVPFEGKPRDLAKQNRKAGFEGKRGGPGGFKGKNAKSGGFKGKGGGRRSNGDFRDSPDFKKRGDDFKKPDHNPGPESDAAGRQDAGKSGFTKRPDAAGKLKPKFGGKNKPGNGGRPPFKGKPGGKSGKGPFKGDRQGRK